MVLLLLPTLPAERNPAGKALFFQVLDAGIIVWELAVKIDDRVPQVLRNCLSAVHNTKNFIKP
jgi:phage-related holin